MHKQTTINKSWNSTNGKMEFSFVFAFKSREQYLEFRSFWKQSYAELGATIRSRKALIKTTMRSREYAGKLQMETHSLSAEATAQLLMLKGAKAEANRQYIFARQPAQ